MSEAVDLAIVGAGPAGMGAGIEAARLGLRTVVLDEQAAPGGQIYRNVEGVHRDWPGNLAVLGPDYSAGLELVRAFRGCGADYRPGTSVFEVGSGHLGVLRDGVASRLATAEIILATGAMERPVPLPGWTLPGVMSAGAAQSLLKASDMVPEGRVVLAGSGPLLFLLALQLAEAGVDLRAILRTSPRGNLWRALPHVLGLVGNPDLAKGLGWIRALKRRGIPFIEGVTALRAEGGECVQAVRYARGGAETRLDADVLLLHEGIVPNPQLARASGAAHDWDAVRGHLAARHDDWLQTSLAGVGLAGDGVEIHGARAAPALGRWAALGAALRLGKLERAAAEQGRAEARADVARASRPQAFLHELYRVPDALLAPADDSTIACRCEALTVVEIRRVLALDVPGPNQLKAFLRAGMGPCQSRMCAATVARLFAERDGRPPEERDHFRLRPPVKPVTVGELAAMEGLDD